MMTEQMRKVCAQRTALLNLLRQIKDKAAARKWNSESTDRLDQEAWAEIEKKAKEAIARFKET